MSSVSNPVSSSRIVAIDLARIFAIVFMVQGHTLDVLLAPQYREGAFFNFWLFLRGLTAPMFLVLAGTSFTVATMRYADRNFGTGVSPRRLLRFATFIVIGYLMHMPARSFSDLQYVNSSGFQAWAQVDVLQCIGLTLLGLQLLVHFARTPARFAATSAILGTLIALSTPLVWAVNWSQYLPTFFAAYLSGASGSLFPLFPWSGYVLLGAAAGYVYSTRGVRSAVPLMGTIGLILVVCGIALQKIPVTVFPPVDFWKTSPELFMVRYGGICLSLSLIAVVLRWVPVPRVLTQTLARESLAAYLIHICILYGSSWNDGLRQSIGATLTPAYTVASFTLLMLITAVLAIGWNYSKRTLPALGKQALYAATASLRTES